MWYTMFTQIYCLLVSPLRVFSCPSSPISQASVLPTNSGSHHSRPGPLVQIRAAPSQVYRWLISFVSFFLNYLNRTHQPSNNNSDVNPIMSLFHSKNLSKAILNFAMPMATGLLLNQYQKLTPLKDSLITMALSLGFASTWSGMLLGGICRRTASEMEIFGAALVIVVLYGLISSFLPPVLVWTSWLCCGLSCMPLVLSLLPLKSAEVTTHLNHNPLRLPV